MENSSFGTIVHDILTLGSHCNCISYSHVLRSGNQVAHMLAEQSRKFEEPRVWMEEGPSEIMSFVSHDLELMI